MRTAVKAGLTATAMIGLTACGGGGIADESADEIMDRAEEATKGASSMRIQADLTQDGEQLSIDGRLGGSDACEIQIETGGVGLELLGVDGDFWMKPSPEFWEAQAGPQASAIIEAVGDNWVIVPDEQIEQFSEMCDVEQFLDSDDDSGSDSTYEKGEESERDGENVIAIDVTDEDGAAGTAYVRTDEPNYLVEMEIVDGDEPGTAKFSEFDEDFDVQAPADDEQIDLEQLGG